jgi:hypothetical protein
LISVFIIENEFARMTLAINLDVDHKFTQVAVGVAEAGAGFSSFPFLWPFYQELLLVAVVVQLVW